MGVIAGSVPFKPNIAALARKLELSRGSVYHYIYQLKDARLLNTLSSEGKGVSTLQKPHKIFLENTNLASDDIESGGGNKVPIWLFGFFILNDLIF